MATFGALFGHNYQTLNVSAAAIASDKISSNGCFYGLNPGDLAVPDVTMGGSSELFANDCGVNVNGNIDMGGHANITAKYVVASGDITDTGKSSITGTETAGSGPPVGDPMSYLQYDSLRTLISRPTPALRPPAAECCVFMILSEG